jgi:hypothetical protein
MWHSRLQIKSKLLLLLIGSQLTVVASCQSAGSSSNSDIVGIQQTDIKGQSGRKQDSSCCQSNIPERFSVPSKKMKPESLHLNAVDN